ncbi:MAG: DUF5132 domain-containing protein [Thermodesulfovibrionales bacterium]
MGLVDDVFKGNIGAGLAIGIGAAVLGPIVLPILAGAAKPIAKAAIKGGLALFEKGKETAAELGEVLEDIVAEAKAELAEEAEKAVSVAAEVVGEGQGV